MIRKMIIFAAVSAAILYLAFAFVLASFLWPREVGYEARAFFVMLLGILVYVRALVYHISQEDAP